MIVRLLEKNIVRKFGRKKAIILLGARQTGKTTLLKEMFRPALGKPGGGEVLWLNGDDADVRSLFDNLSSTRIKLILAKKKFLVIDEAQRIADIGLRLKIITDTLPDIQLIVTGSSSLEIVGKTNEPLTGRKWEYQLYPLSFAEMAGHNGLLEEKRLLPYRLVYGGYPDVINNPGEEREILRLLSDSYLYKDILMWEQIKKPEKLVKLLQALAYQIGSQVSYSELAQICGMDAKTIEKYIVLLEQCFVIFRLGSFSRNLRNELKFSRKIYFVDNGIRNALIGDYSLAETRRDIGALWENYLISERRKKLEYSGQWKNTWFWRTAAKQEIDYLEEGDGKMQAFEFKWSTGKYRPPKTFTEAYPGCEVTVITRDNIEDFLL